MKPMMITPYKASTMKDLAMIMTINHPPWIIIKLKEEVTDRVILPFMKEERAEWKIETGEAHRMFGHWIENTIAIITIVGATSLVAKLEVSTRIPDLGPVGKVVKATAWDHMKTGLKKEIMNGSRITIIMEGAISIVEEDKDKDKDKDQCMTVMAQR